MKFIIRGGHLFLRKKDGFRTGSKNVRQWDSSGTFNPTIVRAMKLVIILLTAACLQVSAKGYSQKVTFSGTNVSLKQVFDAIHIQTGYGIFISGDLLAQTNTVTVTLKDASIEDALKTCLKQQRIELSFYWVGKGIVVNKREQLNEKSTPTYVGEPLSLINAKGVVYNEAGQPLAGANVLVKESGKGVITNAKGEFELHAIPSTSTLLISFIGYTTQLVKVAEDKVLQVYLTVTKNELDKVVVQAYGTTTQRLATANIGVVRAEEIERNPVVNPLEALQGRVAGLIITESSGYASAPFNVEIRGRNSINPFVSSEPLYIIDGVPLTILNVGGNGGGYDNPPPGYTQNGLYGPAGGQSPFFNINPSDIESVEVLKDADATAIYGSRGANGVILITTKGGKSGKTKFDIQAYEGVSDVPRHWKMLNTKQYLEMRREAFRNDGITPTTANAPDLLDWDTTRYTNWQNFLWGNVGKNIKVQTSISGGDVQTTFRIGAGFDYRKEIQVANGSDQRASLSFELAHKTRDQKLGLTLKTIYTYSQTDMIYLPGASILPPDAPPVFDNKGKLNYAEWDAAGPSVGYPFASLLQPYSSNTGFLSSNLKINYEIFKGLNLRASIGYNNTQNHQNQYNTIASQDPIINPVGTSFFGFNRNSGWIIEPQGEYNARIGQGKLNILVGASSQSAVTDGFLAAGRGYTNDALLRTITNAPTQVANDNYGEYKYAAVFGRVNFNWKDKYIVNVNSRRDGSSRFGPGKQYGNFGSLGAAWILSEEGWCRRLLPSVVSFVKLRGSYGLTGSDAVGDYQYLSRWGSTLLPYNGVATLVPTQHADSTFQWQVNKKIELTFDIGLIKDRVNLGITYYRDRCNNQLIEYPLPIFTGFGFVTANFPANVQNSGWEFVMNSKLIDTKKFSWSLNFNIGINKNKLLSYPNLSQSPYAGSLIIGKPLNIAYLFHVNGVDPQTGQYFLQDKNHDGQITLSYSNPGVGDDRYVYDKSTKFAGGFENKFRIKDFELTLFFYFRKKLGINALTDIIPGRMTNAPAGVLNRWQKPGDITNVARFTTASSNSDYYFESLSDGVYTDASFMRLQNATVSYNFPSKMIKGKGVQGMNIFFKGQNLLVITKYKGVDPEVQNFGSMPIARIFTGGISLNF